MNRWVSKVAVVTGASSGIGADVSKELVKQGLQVVGLARRVELIQEYAKTLSGPGKIFPVKCDVSVDADVKKTFAYIEENIGPVSILVNNAGVVLNSTLINGDFATWKKVIDVNLLGLASCSQSAIKHMRKNGNIGHIININSVAGHKCMDNNPNLTNMYSPSKYAVTAYTEILRQELRNEKTQIKVTSISPGFVKTNILEAGGFGDVFSPDVLNTMAALNSEDITDAIIYCLSTKPHVQVHEMIIKPVGEAF